MWGVGVWAVVVCGVAVVRSVRVWWCGNGACGNVSLKEVGGRCGHRVCVVCVVRWGWGCVQGKPSRTHLYSSP